MNTEHENVCIFCLKSDGGFEHASHLIPESASNEDVVLPKGCECDRCNRDFSPMEQQVIRSIPGQFFRVALVDETKRRKTPTAAFKGGRIDRLDLGRLPIIRFFLHNKNPSVDEPKIEPNEHNFRIIFRNPPVQKISAFLARVSLGYFFLAEEDVYSADYDHLRECISSVGSDPFIPFLMGLHAEPTQDIHQVLSNGDACVKTRPVRVRFPGFSGIIPTAPVLLEEDLRSLVNYCTEEIPGHIFMNDPDWNKPVEMNITLKPTTRAAMQAFKKTYNSMK